MVRRRHKAFVWLQLTARRRLDVGRLHRFATEPFPCKCNLLVYLQTRGEVAERLKAAVC